MKIKFYGHNCYFLEGKFVNIITDPWLSNSGAFFGSWFQWPINHHCLSNLLNDIQKNKKNFLYISHEHQDHFDKKTLKEMRPYIETCIIPKYHDSFLKDQITKLGYKVIELNDHEKYNISEKDFIELMIVDTGVTHDSAAIIHIDKKIFVNQNDCKIFDRLVYLEEMNVDYYAVQFSGASWHPVCYSIKEEEKKRISNKKVQSKFTSIRNAVNLIKPKYYLPSAGPAIFPFLDPSLSFGEDNIFVHQPKIDVFFSNSNTQLVYMRPGENFESSLNNPPINPPTFDELMNLKDNLSCSFFKYKDAELSISALKEQILLRLDQIKDIKFSRCPLLFFKWGKQGLKIDLNKGSIEDTFIKTNSLKVDYVSIEATPSYFSLMANQNFRWQDIYLSLRANINRNPDVFNTFINIFLFSDLSNIREGFKTTLSINDQRILIVNPHNGKNFEINRFCPHNGADLKNAKIDKQNNLICPRHSWMFDLENEGKCKTANATIKSKEIEETITICESISGRLLKND